VLTDEEVAVVEGGSGEGDYGLLFAGMLGIEIWGNVGMGGRYVYVVVFGRGLGDCDFLERVVDFAGLAVDFLDYDGGRHCAW
jgi:hypothetical protein